MGHVDKSCEREKVDTVRLKDEDVKETLVEAMRAPAVSGAGRGDEYTGLAVLTADFIKNQASTALLMAGLITSVLATKVHELRDRGLPDNVIKTIAGRDLESDPVMRDILTDVLYAGFLLGKKEAELATR